MVSGPHPEVLGLVPVSPAARFPCDIAGADAAPAGAAGTWPWSAGSAGLPSCGCCAPHVAAARGRLAGGGGGDGERLRRRNSPRGGLGARPLKLPAAEAGGALPGPASARLAADLLLCMGAAPLARGVPLSPPWLSSTRRTRADGRLSAPPVSPRRASRAAAARSHAAARASRIESDAHRGLAVAAAPAPPRRPPMGTSTTALARELARNRAAAAASPLTRPLPPRLGPSCCCGVRRASSSSSCSCSRSHS
jgi:hypothetical protein